MEYLLPTSCASRYKRKAAFRYLYILQKLLTTRDHGNVQSRDQEESKLNSKIYANIGAHTIIHDKIIKTPFNKNNVETIETNKIITKIPLLGSIK